MRALAVKKLYFCFALAAMTVGFFTLWRLNAQDRPFVRMMLVPEYTYKVINVYPHDSAAFTEGLEYRDGFLYESTGGFGPSSVRKVDLGTGQVLEKSDLQPQYFGEGLTLFNENLLQLTWQTQTGFIYDQATLRPIRTFSYSGEGWGL